MASMRRRAVPLALFSYSILLTLMGVITLSFLVAGLIVFSTVKGDPLTQLALRVLGFNPDIEVHLAIIMPVLLASAILVLMLAAPFEAFLEAATLVLLVMPVLGLATLTLEPTLDSKMLIASVYAVSASLLSFHVARRTRQLALEPWG